jgi:ATP-dependent RNA helicase DHX29
MAKKKKTRLEPVARPIATISVPKKVITEDDVSAGLDSSTSVGEETDAKLSASEGNGDGIEPALLPEGLDSSKIEEQSLQNLIDKLQDRTEKEIVRNVKVCFFLQLT